MSDATFLFDFGSPNAYFAHRLVPGVETRTGRRIRYVPVLLGGLFKLTGNAAPMVAFRDIPAKLAYQRHEIARFVRRHELSNFRFNPHFPVNTLQIMRGAAGAELAGPDLLARYVEAMFRGMWEEERKLDDPAVIAATLADAGLPPALLEQAASSAAKDRLQANTEAAADRGAFGSPSFLIDDQLFFGKDSMPDLEWWLRRADNPPRSVAP